jgi:hypothetical protein
MKLPAKAGPIHLKNIAPSHSMRHPGYGQALLLSLAVMKLLTSNIVVAMQTRPVQLRNRTLQYQHPAIQCGPMDMQKIKQSRFWIAMAISLAPQTAFAVLMLWLTAR